MNINTAVLSIGVLFFCGISFSQTKNEIKDIKKELNLNKVQVLKSEINTYNSKLKNKIEQATAKGFTTDKLINGKLYTIVGFYENKPIYQTINNIDAATSTRANFLWQGGSLGLNLEGQNMTIGIWDQHRTRKDHVEFVTNGTSRVILGDATPFDQDDFGSHGTHVGGTMVAAGVDADAKGMAPKATLVSYNWDDDLNEVQTEITNNGLLISNHSYGIPVVDDNGNQNAPTWLMGNYDTQARLWDLMANTSPYYLMVVSAGNDGNSNYSGGLKSGYDKLTGEKNAKNNLVVGNAQDASVNSSSGDLLFPVFINQGSSQGPSDDGRIKPDVVGNGTQLYSPVDASTSSYATFSGTSMAAPNVAGTLLLVQQHYNNIKGDYLFASTLKGLAIHTADDLGSTGPDATFGWGLVNSKKAVELINASTIDEARIEYNQLSNGDNFSFEVKKKLNEDLKVTIVWNDPAGTARDGQLNNSTSALVNDLDLRVINKSNSNISLPWKLNLSDVAAAATKGDNQVDNVENIIIDSNDDGIYEIKITHKGTLNNPQNVSIIVSGVQYTDLNSQSISLDEKIIKVWPNPVRKSQALNIDMTELVDNVQTISLYDLQGRLVIRNLIKDNNKITTLDTQHLQTGMYVLEINTPSSKIQKKIIIK